MRKDVAVGVDVERAARAPRRAAVRRSEASMCRPVRASSEQRGNPTRFPQQPSGSSSAGARRPPHGAERVRVPNPSSVVHLAQDAEEEEFGAAVDAREVGEAHADLGVGPERAAAVRVLEVRAQAEKDLVKIVAKICVKLSVDGTPAIITKLLLNVQQNAAAIHHDAGAPDASLPPRALSGCEDYLRAQKMLRSPFAAPLLSLAPARPLPPVAAYAPLPTRGRKLA